MFIKKMGIQEGLREGESILGPVFVAKCPMI